MTNFEIPQRKYLGLGIFTNTQYNYTSKRAKRHTMVDLG